MLRRCFEKPFYPTKKDDDQTKKEEEEEEEETESDGVEVEKEEKEKEKREEEAGASESEEEDCDLTDGRRWIRDQRVRRRWVRSYGRSREEKKNAQHSNPPSFTPTSRSE